MHDLDSVLYPRNWHNITDGTSIKKRKKEKKNDYSVKSNKDHPRTHHEA